jgi:hypothetical protein
LEPAVATSPSLSSEVTSARELQHGVGSQSLELASPQKTWASAPVTDSMMQRLLATYSRHIAPLMVWVDSDQNEYKRLVLPLAETQQSLKLAILAVAAAYPLDQSRADADFSQQAYEQSLRMITERLRCMARQDSPHDVTGSENTADSNEGVLAAAIVLANHSRLLSESSTVRVHHHAARTLVRSININGPLNPDLFLFLKNQLAINDVLRCTTVFDPDFIRTAALPEDEHGNVLFSSYLEVIHKITILSLEQEHQEISTHALIISDLEDQFELASSATLYAATTKLKSRDRSAREDFSRLVRIFHHCGVLYACKRLDIANTGPIEEYHAERVFKLFDTFDDLHKSLYNLAWPIFIAGICCWPHIEKVRKVEELSSLLVKNTPFGNSTNVPEFLGQLWTSDHCDWKRLAREWQEEGLSILAV